MISSKSLLNASRKIVEKCKQIHMLALATLDFAFFSIKIELGNLIIVYSADYIFKVWTSKEPQQ